MSTHHRSAGRRRALAALVVPLTIAASLVAAAPASADTNTYADAIGEDTTSLASDVTQYQVSATGSTVSFTFWTTATAASPLPGDAMVVADFETTGDESVDFEALMDDTGTTWTIYDAASFATVCSNVPGTMTVNSASFTAAASCFGSPAQVKVAFWVDATGGYDFTPNDNLTAFSAPVAAGPDVAPTTTPQTVVYRFWSPKFNNAHFFTTNETEAEHILFTDLNWKFEGKAFSALAASGETCTEGSAVYRFYSPVFQSHFYTQNADEKAHIIAADRNWNYEGVAYCAYTSQQPGTTALYRFWSPGFGKHFFTANKDEADHIIAVDRNWNYEGIAYYVLPGV